MPANNLTDSSESTTLIKTTKSITIPAASASSSTCAPKATSNYEELMMHTQAQLRDLKTSQNVTESVPVPSSEHVAEIVGRQGCKIKALRAKTNTYIKTPVRGEAPMFVITGRKEDVHTAKREIQLAADHFSQIRARRVNSTGQPAQAQVQQQLSPIQTSDSQTTSIKIDSTSLITNPSNLLLSSSSGSSSSSISVSPPILSTMSSYSAHRSSSNSPTSSILIKPSPIDLNDPIMSSQQQDDLPLTSAPLLTQQLQPGQIVKKVSVPYQVVGLVVGPKGSTIKRIQQNTNTYIVTPSRDSQPVFEIQGLPDNVEAAKLEIENYIMLRTSSTAQTTPITGQTGSNQTFDQLFTDSTSSYSKQLDFELFNNVIDILDDLKLMSPNSSSLFKSVAAVVDDDTYSSAATNQTSNIWSSPPALSSASSSTSQITNDDPVLFKTDHRSSISSSSSSDTSSTDLFGAKHFETATLPLFMNEQASFDFSSSIMSAFSATTSSDPFLTSQASSFVANFLPQANTSLSSSISSSHSTNENALNSLFQQHESLLLNNQSESLAYLTTSTANDFLQQSQFNQQYY